MALPAWFPLAAAASTVAILTIASFLLPHPDWDQDIRVAFFGNSMQYYNDCPRFLEALSGGHIQQNSCFHGGATLASILVTGNGMAWKFDTNNSLIEGHEGIHDYGTCTVRQLLFGYDDRIAEVVENLNYDDGGDDVYAYIEAGQLYSDGTNACFEDAAYREYLEDYYSYEENKPQWDYIVLNDNTRGPPRYSSRQESLEVLESTYISFFQEAGAIPVFIHTHAYWSENRDMGGLKNVSTFTSLTYVGYTQYAELVAASLPESQAPRIAPVGIAYLTVWEEDYNLWDKLIHSDDVHASPLGTYLQGCVIYYTLFGRMPNKQYALPDDMSSLWSRARRMQPPQADPNPIPTREEAEYLYRVAERVARFGYRPDSFIAYENGEAARYDEELGWY